MIPNAVFWAVAFAGATAQLAKIALILIRHRQTLHVADLFVTGGMPSSHSALVVALVVSIFMTEGVSTVFVLAAVLAAITIRDAMGVRRTAGEEGRIIHEILKRLRLKIPEYHYALGHKPEEVLVGCVIGAVTAFIVVLV
jgi:acid phosphatase family membrane protein YuiD